VLQREICDVLSIAICHELALLSKHSNEVSDENNIRQFTHRCEKARIRRKPYIMYNFFGLQKENLAELFNVFALRIFEVELIFI